MPWFLNPNVYNKLPLYQNPELYLFIFNFAATAVFALLLWRQGNTGKRQLLGAAYIFFYGTFLTVMLFMHNLVILGLRIFEPASYGNFTFDFHLYSLILLGAILFLQGVRLLRAAMLIKAGDERGSGQALRATGIVLALAIPLIPIQFFGIVLTVFSLLNLAAIKLLLRRAAAVSPAPPGAETTLLPISKFGFDS